MVRSLLFAFVFAPLAPAQNQPAFQWVEQIDSSAGDGFAGLGVDGAGNIYIAGSTYSGSFPAKNAAQPQLASAGLYQINGPAFAYSKLGVSSASFVAIDPQDPRILYVLSSNYGSSSNGVLKSLNGGASFTPLSLPSTSIYTLAIDPSNDQILYAGTFDQGLLKSTDGGIT
jgi:hypothetical protein